MGNNNSSGVNVDLSAENLKMPIAVSKDNPGKSQDAGSSMAFPGDTTIRLQEDSPEEDARDHRKQEARKFSDSQLESTLMMQSDQKDSIKQVDRLAEAGTVKRESLQAVSSSRDIECFSEKPKELHLADEVSMETSDDIQIEKEVSIKRLSCVSNSENLNIYFQKQKTPSFDCDLRIKASPKEFDQTPLQCDTVHLSLNSQADQYDQAQLQYTSSTSQDEKFITSDKKCSDTSQAAKLGLSGENENFDAQTSSNKREKQVSATPPKAEEKRKNKSSPFSNFICCAAVFN